ncbi:MAG: Rpn family recombination-promoting nuclease/putative transposase [Treponema sp.]|jgi:hypothetical protein|nr:Rpn family recombination-promoting nuclease/putative transposase [Treponema sp.]
MRPPAFPERLDPLNDYLFLRVMGEKGDEVQLLCFLNAVLGRTGDDRLASVEIIENKTLPAEFLGGKTSILDVRKLKAMGISVEQINAATGLVPQTIEKLWQCGVIPRRRSVLVLTLRWLFSPGR